MDMINQIKIYLSEYNEEHLKNWQNKIDQTKKESYESLRITSNEIVEIYKTLNQEFISEYSNKIVELTQKRQQLITLKHHHNRKYSKVEERYFNIHYKTFFKFKETTKITKSDFSKAFEIAFDDNWTAKTLRSWKNEIEDAEEIIQSTMDIINSAKKHISVLTDGKW